MKLVLMLIGTLLVLLLVLANMKNLAVLRTPAASGEHAGPVRQGQQPAVVDRVQADLQRAQADAAARERSAEE